MRREPGLRRPVAAARTSSVTHCSTPVADQYGNHKTETPSAPALERDAEPGRGAIGRGGRGVAGSVGVAQKIEQAGHFDARVETMRQRHLELTDGADEGAERSRVAHRRIVERLQEPARAQLEADVERDRAEIEGAQPVERRRKFARGDVEPAVVARRLREAEAQRERDLAQIEAPTQLGAPGGAEAEHFAAHAAVGEEAAG